MGELPNYVWQWRDGLLAKGWRMRDRHGPPCERLVEYHALYRGEIYSGRCRISRSPQTLNWGALTHEAVLLCNEPHAVQVWRLAEPEKPEVGPIKRPPRAG
ncbi:hypothetical protein F0A16_20460 [Salinicola corii]|uniref:Uncharacterized protein n=1 Tax=Salinicola corii TaxID=2606937 RepID=A0A640W758_9GAMM|nr:hypothetical protein [Salinicola corii]KAA0015465.1 hypothetical protein F0A16_20460 [Salinicola corii]